MSEIVTTTVGRFRHVTPDAWLWECPCGQWSYLTTDQWAGRVSVDHASQGCPVKYHETHNYEAELVATMQARILTGEPPIDPVSPVEPEPCVWRLGGQSRDIWRAHGSYHYVETVEGWKVCPYCGAPLKVER